MIIPARFPRKGTFDMLRAFVLASAWVAVATATPGNACSAKNGVGGENVCDSGEICCGSATTIGTGETTGTCVTGSKPSDCPASKTALCRASTSIYQASCPTGTCTNTASSTSYSVPCTTCPVKAYWMPTGSSPPWTPTDWDEMVLCSNSGGYCYCRRCPGSLTTCDLGTTDYVPSTLGQPCSAEDGIGSGKCDSDQVCCTTSTSIGTGENTGTCRSGDEYSACNTGEEPLCSQATAALGGKPICSGCSGTASTNTWSVPCNNCPNYLSSTSSTSSKTSCSGGTCKCSYCPSGTPSGGTCALNSSNSDWEDAASGLATGIIVVIVLCVLVFVVLPVVLCILICFCGVALCGMGAQAATQAPAANGGMTHAGAAQPQMTMGAANPQPPGATYMKNGVWLDANDRPVQS